MKSKTKSALRKTAPLKRTKPALGRKLARGRKNAERTEVSPGAREFAKVIWPSIKKSTKFVQVPEFQSTVTYTMPSDESVTVGLKWYSVSRGPRILGHYDDANDVCYVGKFIEG
jgi:hypothetical protein